MAYTRNPNTIIAGLGLKQNPPPSPLDPAGALPVTIDAEIATTATLGSVIIGANISVTPEGVISVAAPGTGDDIYSVKLTSTAYTTTATDYFVGTTSNSADITLPTGVLGKVYVIKNQASGNIKVFPTSPDTIDGAAFKTLGNNASIMVIFDGNRWNII